MFGRRSRRARDETSFGTSLADILTTALGCVLLIFLVAVSRVKSSLDDEKRAHQTTQADLVAESAELEAEGARRLAAEDQRAREARNRLAVEAALQDAKGEKGALATALVDARAEREAMAKRLAEANALIEGERKRNVALREAATKALRELDPRTAQPVDVVLVIDGTGSMKPSLDSTRSNLAATMDALRVVSPTARVGVTVFRDKREVRSMRLESHPLTAKSKHLSAFLAGIKATSTARDTDLAEWLCGGIEHAAAADWRPDAIRLMIVVSDAAAQSKRAVACIRQAKRFRAAGGRLHMLTTRPRGYGSNRIVRRNYRKVVLPQHARIAKAGGGIHVVEADANALLNRVLASAFESRSAKPIESLRTAIEASEAPATPPEPPENTPPETPPDE